LVTVTGGPAAASRRKLFTGRVASRPGVADMLGKINDEQRPCWFLIMARPNRRGQLPLVDFLQRSSHQRCFVVLG
jgi:hypothetical protein